VTLTVIALRMLWQLFMPPLGARLWPSDEVLALPRRERTLIGWCGLRGAISLAIALSIPVTLDGEPFPGRSLLLFLTLVVVLTTLVGQGITLPAAIRLLKVSQSEEEQGQGLLARRRAAEAALAVLEERVANGEVQEESARALRPLYEARLERLREVSAGNEPPESSVEIHRLRLQLLQAQREAVRRLYESDQIGADVQVEITHEIDLEETRLRRREKLE
jgi:CPA1 family monovalent cation:H+ antiporter